MPTGQVAETVVLYLPCHLLPVHLGVPLPLPLLPRPEPPATNLPSTGTVAEVVGVEVVLVAVVDTVQQLAAQYSEHNFRR